MSEDISRRSLERLHKLLAGRQPYPWGRSVGIARGTIGRMLTGSWPDPTRLVQMCRMESVSLSWLVAGAGAPYTIERCTDPDSCIQLFLEAKRIAHAVAVRSPKGDALLLGAKPIPDSEAYEWIQWTLCLAPALTPDVVSGVGAQLADARGAVRYLELSRAKFSQLLRAEVGTFTLLGSSDAPSKDAWMDDSSPCTPGDLVGMLRSSSSAFYTPTKAERSSIAEPRYQESEVDQLFNRCSTSQQLALIEILRGLTRH